MSTKQQIFDVLQMLSSAYPHFKLTKGSVDVYTELLSDLPADKLRAAALQCATRGNFFPCVAELRRAAVDLILASNQIPDTYSAWSDVSEGPQSELIATLSEDDGLIFIDHHPRKWSHPFVERVARLLGWPKSFPTDNPVADRAQFIRAYETLLEREMSALTRLPQVNEFIQSERLRLEAKND